MSRNSYSVELDELREAAIISSIYHSDIRKFRRNSSLSHVVHALFHFSQFLSALAVELFHHLHHAVNRTRRRSDPLIPELPEERNLIFFAPPVSMIVSFILCPMWIFLRNFGKQHECAIIGCTIGITFMLLSGIFSMRHAELHINLNEVSDYELLRHPIFIHNFVICMLSVFSLMLYTIHFWILYDCIRWKFRKNRLESPSRETAGISGESDVSQSPATTSAHKEPTAHQLTPIPMWDQLHHTTQTSKTLSVQNDPVILYLCCLDLWNYLMHDELKNRANHEFQVVHVI